jgi:glucose/arabinose dehydrogenase
MNYLTHSTLKQLLWVGLIGLAACNSTNVPLNSYNNQNQTASPAVDTKVSAVENQACTFVKDGFGPQGKVKVGIEEVASGLEVPWGIAFLPRGDMLVTERPGRVRLVQNGKLQNTVVASVKVAKSGEGGLLGIAVHPDFAQNRFFYLYYTADKNGSRVNRVERWQLSSDRLKASPDRIIIDDIPAAVYHDGGRLRFGPDGMLYIGTGDGRKPNSSQDINSLAGKILRLTPDGQVPQDNPFPNNPVFVTGIRNTQGFDWLNKSTLWVTDHGPSGELGRTGHDKVSIAKVGDNLGWPVIYGCESRKGMVTPSLSWEQAVPPGGAAIYTGNTIPEWKGNLIVGTLGSRHLHRIVFDLANPRRVRLHEVYFQNQLGRLREVVMGPDGQLYVTTSNCDGRGECPPQKDKILRITR